MANIYDEFIIVDEKSITENCGDFSAWAEYINSKFSDLTDFDSLELKMVDELQCLQIKDAAASHSTNGLGPLAQIVSWKWDGGTQKIEKSILLDRGDSTDLECLKYSVVIRILKKRQVIENPCPPLSSPDDNLTVHIGDRQVTVSASLLMGVSPVIERMLSVEMKEKRTLNLDGHDITMEQFMQFLETVNDHLQHGQTLPNPTNVLVLLKLADHFQIDWLKERCEAHLINCVEIPLFERFLLIEPYRLNDLKNFFLRDLNVVTLGEFVVACYEQKLLSAESITQEFWFELNIRLCRRE
uniref:BTB domain-containing protein n=1 Tax=Globodera rostochiensis TaxID=31243 RepID=A0A914GTB0_GLORO